MEMREIKNPERIVIEASNHSPSLPLYKKIFFAVRDAIFPNSDDRKIRVGDEYYKIGDVKKVFERHGLSAVGLSASQARDFVQKCVKDEVQSTPKGIIAVAKELHLSVHAYIPYGKGKEINRSEFINACSDLAGFPKGLHVFERRGPEGRMLDAVPRKDTISSSELEKLKWAIGTAGLTSTFLERVEADLKQGPVKRKQATYLLSIIRGNP